MSMDEPMLRVYLQEPSPPRTAYDERPGRWVGEPPGRRRGSSVRETALRRPGAARWSRTQAHGVLAGTFVAWASRPTCRRTSAREDAPLPGLPDLAAGRPDRGARRPRGGAGAGGRPAGGARGRAPVRRRRGRRLAPGRPRRPQPHAPRRTRRPPPVHAGRTLLRGRPAVVHRARVRAGPPRPRRRVADLVAPCLAVAGARAPDAARRRAAAARAAARPGRRSCSSRSSRRCRHRRSPSSAGAGSRRRGSSNAISRRAPPASSTTPTGGRTGSSSTPGLECEDWNTDTFEIRDDDPLSARVTCEWEVAVGRGTWRTRIRTWSELTADAAAFHTVEPAAGLRGRRVWCSSASGRSRCPATARSDGGRSRRPSAPVAARRTAATSSSAVSAKRPVGAAMVSAAIAVSPSKMGAATQVTPSANSSSSRP